jgi:HlyD family secretion protein
VVTYPVLVAAANPDLKLLPGMTANLVVSGRPAERSVKIPNAALRFFPESQHVRESDRELLQGGGIPTATRSGTPAADLGGPAGSGAPAQDATSRLGRGRRVLKAIAVETGLSDGRHTEVVSGELDEDQSLVTGLQRN